MVAGPPVISGDHMLGGVPLCEEHRRQSADLLESMQALPSLLGQLVSQKKWTEIDSHG